MFAFSHFYLLLLPLPSLYLIDLILQLNHWCLSAHHNWMMRVLSLIVPLTSLLISPVTWTTWFRVHVSSQSSCLCPFKVPFAYSKWNLCIICVTKISLIIAHQSHSLVTHIMMIWHLCWVYRTGTNCSGLASYRVVQWLIAFLSTGQLTDNEVAFADIN